MNLSLLTIKVNILSLNQLYEIETPNDDTTKINEIIDFICQKFNINSAVSRIIVCHSSGKYRILGLLETVQSARLTSRDELLILTINTKYIANLYLQHNCINEDAILARLPEAVVPNDVEAAIKIKLIFDNLQDEGKLCGLILLALLRWRDDEIVLQTVKAMIPLGSPIDIAPHASISFTTEDFNFIQDIWNPQPQEFSCQQLTLQDAISEGLIEELANCFDDLDKARYILAEIGFPNIAIPKFENRMSFWQEICGEIHKGKEPGSIKILLKSAAKQYPKNTKFCKYK